MRFCYCASSLSRFRLFYIAECLVCNNVTYYDRSPRDITKSWFTIDEECTLTISQSFADITTINSSNFSSRHLNSLKNLRVSNNNTSDNKQRDERLRAITKRSHENN